MSEYTFLNQYVENVIQNIESLTCINVNMNRSAHIMSGFLSLNYGTMFAYTMYIGLCKLSSQCKETELHFSADIIRLR
jgi:hypothetical protein